jgi:phage terminase large subunit-like protein
MKTAGGPPRVKGEDLLERIAQLTPDDRDRFLASATPAVRHELHVLYRRANRLRDTIRANAHLTWRPCDACQTAGWNAETGWLEGHKHARPKQLLPAGRWRTFFLMAGRGSGKTKTAVEYLVERISTLNDLRVGVIFPTFTDGRLIGFEGKSGLHTVLTARGIEHNYNRTTCEILVYATNSIVQLYTAEKPERLRGPEHHIVWIDEPGSLTDRQALGTPSDPGMWGNATFGCRLTLPDGSSAHLVITGTPRRTRLVKMLDKLHRTDPALNRYVHATTDENAANLDPVALAELEAMYAGTVLGAQELGGQLLDDVEGALWTQARIDASRIPQPEQFERIIIAVDPAASDDGDECGIITLGSYKHDAWVLADDTRHGLPHVWAPTVIDACIAAGTGTIVMETNLVGSTMQHAVKEAHKAAVAEGRWPAGTSLRIEGVKAQGSKGDRALPISGLYPTLPTADRPATAGRVHHADSPRLHKLEDEMTTWVPPERGQKASGQRSPNRIDALVHGVKWLILGGPPELSAEVAGSIMRDMGRVRR